MAVVDGGGGAVLLVGVAEADVERSSELASLSSRATILSNNEYTASTSVITCAEVSVFFMVNKSETKPR